MKLPRALLATLITVNFANKAVESQKPTVFAFDIHGVLMQLKVGEVVGTSLKELSQQPGLLLKIGDFFNGGAADHAAMRRIFNCQEPVCGTWGIVKELKAAGHSLYIFSNIGEKTFKELQEKYPNWFDIFDGYHTVPSNDKKLRKPKPKAFASFKKMVHEKHPIDTQIVFIDDKSKNIKAAREAGFVTIHFSSAEQLKKELDLLF
jgi:hypothetical protein